MYKLKSTQRAQTTAIARISRWTFFHSERQSRSRPKRNKVLCVRKMSCVMCGESAVCHKSAVCREGVICCESVVCREGVMCGKSAVCRVS